MFSLFHFASHIYERISFRLKFMHFLKTVSNLKNNGWIQIYHCQKPFPRISNKTIDQYFPSNSNCAKVIWSVECDDKDIRSLHISIFIWRASSIFSRQSELQNGYAGKNKSVQKYIRECRNCRKRTVLIN